MYKFLKRAIDLFGAILALVIFLPIVVMSIAAIFVTMGRPIFFTQERSGKGQKPFQIFKLRTMKIKKNENDSDDERITNLGEILRKYSIDELPQLINVLRGDMSLVGPRPLLVDYDDKFSKHHKVRFLVQPGITGLAQVSGRNTMDWKSKLDYDVEYVQNSGLLLDLKILLKTIIVVVSARGFKRSGETSRFDA